MKSASRSPWDLANELLLLAGALLIPLFHWMVGKDSFVLPKELLLRGEAILLGANMLLSLLARRPVTSGLRWKSPEVVIPLAAVAWTAIATLASDSPRDSFESLLTVAAAATVFVATVVAARQGAGGRVAGALFISCALNAGLAVLQETQLWNPFILDAPPSAHVATTGFMGNPNMVGSLLLVPALAAIVLTVCLRGRRRAGLALLSLLLVGGLVASLTLTAVIALVAGFATFAFLWKPRWAAAGSVLMGLMVIAALLMSSAVRGKFKVMAVAASTGDWDTVLSARLTPYLAAAEMTRTDPLTGMGPGRFQANYFEYQILARQKHASMFPHRSWSDTSFGETHNDHLQLLAEAGIPAYLLLLAAFVAVGRLSFVPLAEKEPAPATKKRKKEERAAPPPAQALFVRYGALTLTVGFAVLALAQFPLQLAAPRLATLTFAALLTGWSSR